MSELDGECVEDFLTEHPYAVTYAGLGVIPNRFIQFLSERVEFENDGTVFENMDIETFSSLMNIRIVEFARFHGGKSSKRAIVRNLVERWAIAFFKHVNKNNCLNDSNGCDILRGSFRSNYDVIAPDPKKLREEHRIRLKKFKDEAA